MMKSKVLATAAALAMAVALQAQTNELIVQAKKLGAEIQPTMYGLFSKTLIMPLMADCMRNW